MCLSLTPEIKRTDAYLGLAVNFLLIESLQRFYQYYGDELQIECPTGSGDYMNLVEVAEEIQHRIIHIFGRDAEGRLSTNGGNPKLDRDPHFRDYIWFHEVCFCIVSLTVIMLITGVRSSFMPTMGAVLVHHTRLAGTCLVLVTRPVLDMVLRSGLVAYHILQSGATCRLPRTPKSMCTALLSYAITSYVFLQLLAVSLITTSTYVRHLNACMFSCLSL